MATTATEASNDPEETRLPLAGSDTSRPCSGRWRLWPAAVILAAYWGFVGWVYLVEPVRFPLFFVQVLGGPVVALAMTGWWLFGSRTAWSTKWPPLLAGLAGFAAAMALAPTNTGIVMVLYGLPVAVTFGALAAVSNRVRPTVIAIAGVWLLFALIRYEGVSNGFEVFRWRWTATSEDRFLAAQSAQGVAARTATDRPVARSDVRGDSATEAAGPPLVARPGDWTAFRGPAGDATVRDAALLTNWTQPPRVVWQRLVGPAWSSLVVVDDSIFTLEQRGPRECLVAYATADGRELWVAGHDARYTDPPSGTGPRATPAFAEGRVLAYGATGELFCVDARTGTELWRQFPLKDVERTTPLWGVASSPLVRDGRVLVFAGGTNERALLAFDLLSGQPAWSAGLGTTGWSSPQPAKLSGVEQVLLATDAGLEAVSTEGKSLWRYSQTSSGGRTLQPACVGEDLVVLASPDGGGLRGLRVALSDQQWNVTETWHNTTWKSNFSDAVVHEGHLYGFDGLLLACIDLSNGRRKWKGGRYGNGQMLLLAEQDLLLISAETGELALVEALPERFRERARIPAIEGKSWSHPALVGGRLYLRNAERMLTLDLTTRVDGRAEVERGSP